MTSLVLVCVRMSVRFCLDCVEQMSPQGKHCGKQLMKNSLINIINNVLMKMLKGLCAGLRVGLGDIKYHSFSIIQYMDLYGKSLPLQNVKRVHVKG